MYVSSRRVKIIACLLMSLGFLWMLVYPWIDARGQRQREGANELVLQLTQEELFLLEVNPRVDPVVRTARLRRLAESFASEAEKELSDPVLQAESLILMAEAGWQGEDLAARTEMFTLKENAPLLYQFLHGTYFGQRDAMPEATQLLDRMGESWFSLTALIHLAEDRGDRETADRYRQRLLTVASSAAARLGMLSLFLGAVMLGGILVWLWYLLRGAGCQAEEEKILAGAPWNVLDGIFLFLFFFWTVTGLSYLFAPWVGIFDANGTLRGLQVLALYLVQVVAGIVLIQRLFFKRGLLQTLQTMGLVGSGLDPGSSFRWGAGGYLAAMPIVLAALYLSSVLFGVTPVTTNPLVPLLLRGATVSDRLLYLVTLSVLAPFFEEIFFRGFLFNAFRSRLGTPAGMVLSSLFFALVHFDFSVFLGLFSLGMMLAFVYQRTQSLVPSILLHSLWNTTTLMVLQFLFP